MPGVNPFPVPTYHGEEYDLSTESNRYAATVETLRWIQVCLLNPDSTSLAERLKQTKILGSAVHSCLEDHFTFTSSSDLWPDYENLDLSVESNRYALAIGTLCRILVCANLAEATTLPMGMTQASAVEKIESFVSGTLRDLEKAHRAQALQAEAKGKG